MSFTLGIFLTLLYLLSRKKEISSNDFNNLNNSPMPGKPAVLGPQNIVGISAQTPFFLGRWTGLFQRRSLAPDSGL